MKGLGMENYECEIMSWEQFGSLAADLAEIVKKDYKPDVIVGLTRGGWAPSRVLCDHLGIKNLASLKVEHWGITATPDGSAKIKNSLNADVKDKKVLVVDDLTDTGESMALAVDYVKNQEPAEVRTAVLMNIKGSKFVPDYYVKDIGWKWVIFPWNFVEDMKNIIPKVMDGNDSAEEIRTKLKQSFKIDVDEAVIEEIIGEIRSGNIKSEIENKNFIEKRYICLTCYKFHPEMRGVSINEFESGDNICKQEKCTRNGEPLEPADYCIECDKIYPFLSHEHN